PRFHPLRPRLRLRSRGRRAHGLGRHSHPQPPRALPLHRAQRRRCITFQLHPRQREDGLAPPSPPPATRLLALDRPRAHAPLTRAFMKLVRPFFVAALFAFVASRAFAALPAISDPANDPRWRDIFNALSADTT